MPIATVPVTCRAFDLRGQPMAGAVFLFLLNRTVIVGGFVVPKVVSVKTDAQGIAVANLVPSATDAYSVVGRQPGGMRTFLEASVIVPAVACELHELVGGVVIPPPAPIVFPVPRNNLVAMVGDSRTSINGITASLTPTNDLTAYGYAAWLQMLCGYRFKIIDNFGVNANTLDQMLTRLTSVETRGQILNSAADTFIFWGGVNNTTEPIGTVGPKLLSLINQLTGNGKTCYVFDEAPNSDQSGQGAAHLARSQFLDGAVYTNDGRVVRFASYPLMALTPTSYFPKVGYYGDILHPATRGHRELAGGMAPDFNQMFASYPVRNTLATVKSAGAPMFNGTGGSIGAGATGVMADDWQADDVPSGLQVLYSKGVDADGYEQQIITVSGTPTAPVPQFAQWFLNNYSVPAAFAASGDTLMFGARVVVNAGNSGLSAVEMNCSATDNSNAINLKGVGFAFNVYDNSSTNTASWLAGDLQGQVVDGVMLSQPLTLGAGWTASASKAFGRRIGITFRTGAPVSAVIKLSRATMLKNV